MKTKHNISFIIIFVLTFACFLGCLAEQNYFAACFAGACIGAIAFGYFATMEYAINGDTYRKIVQNQDSQLENYKQMVKLYEEKDINNQELYILSEIQRACYFARIIFYKQAILEFIKNDKTNAITYANRWLEKADETVDLINNTYNKNSTYEEIEGMFKGLIDAEEKMNTSELDIDRTI